MCPLVENSYTGCGGPEKGLLVEVQAPQAEADSLHLGRLLGQEDRVDSWQNTTLGDGDALEDLAKLFIVEYGQLEVAGNDPGLLVVSGSIASQLQDLSSQVLQHRSQVDGSSLPGPGGVVPLLQLAVNFHRRELEASLGGEAGRLPESPGPPRSLVLGSKLDTSLPQLSSGCRHDDVRVV